MPALDSEPALNDQFALRQLRINEGTIVNTNDDMRNGGFEPIMALPLGSSLGLVLGILLGPLLFDNIAAGIGIGLAFGSGAGGAVYGLLQESAGNDGDAG